MSEFRIVRTSTRPVVVRLYESLLDTHLVGVKSVEAEPGIEERDATRIELGGAAGFYFAKAKVLHIDIGGGQIREFEPDAEHCEDQGPTYWCPGTTIGTDEELLREFPDEKDLILEVPEPDEELSGQPVKDQLVRLCTVENEDGEPDENGDDIYVIYVRCCKRDQVLPNDHGARTDDAEKRPQLN